jgi:hypothetical protein
MSPATPLSGVARARTLYFLAHRTKWPQWPFLPVVRRRPARAEPELGVLFDSVHAGGPPGYACAVFLTNLFLLPPRLEEFLALPREVFDVPEEVADAGWSVDE